MNNSKLSLDRFLETSKPDNSLVIKERETTLVRLVETLRRVAASEDWSSLKKMLWDDVVETLERQQKSEAEKTPADPVKLAQITGQLVWARKYSDLDKLASVFMTELQGIRSKQK